MPIITTGLRNNPTIDGRFSAGSDVTCIDGRLIHCQISASIATGTKLKNAPRQPMIDPR